MTEEQVASEDASINNNERHTALHRMKEFCYYFVTTNEENFKTYLDILECNPNPKLKSSSLPGTALAALAMVIPAVGKGVSAVIKEADKFAVKRLDKNKARLFSMLVYNQRDNKQKFRSTMVTAAMVLFKSYEMALMPLTCHGGQTKAMQKLAEDACHRYTAHILESIVDESLTTETIIKGVLHGPSSGLMKNGRTFTKINEETTLKSGKIYSKVGIISVSDGKKSLCTAIKLNPVKYGYRFLFSWENLDDIGQIWEHKDAELSYDFELENLDLAVEAANIMRYIVTKDPLEEVIDNQHIIHETTVQLIEQKHSDIKDVIVSSHTEIISTIHVKHEEVLKDNQVKHEEVTRNIEEIKSKDAELEETAIALKNEIDRIKENESSDNGRLVLTTEAFTENYEVKKIHRELRRIGETLKDNNVGPCLKKAEKDVRRFLKKF